MIPKTMVLLTLLVLWTRPAAGDDLGTGAEPRLLLLQLATTEEGERREARFAEELAMVLEGVTVVPRQPFGKEFVNLSLGDQIAGLRPMMKASGAIAAIWMTEPRSDQLLLHLLVISTGRAFVRLIEIDTVEGFEADLALSAKELLGTAFLFERVPKTETESLERVVESVRKEAVRPISEQQQTETATKDRSTKDWAVKADAYLEGGLVSARGPSMLLGAMLALERHFVKGLSAYVSIGLAGGPLDSGSDNIQVDTVTIAPGLGMLYLWHLGRIALGPGVQVHANWSNVSLVVEQEDTQVFRTWQLRGSVTLEARLSAAEYLSIAAAGGIVSTPEQDVYKLVETGEVILATYHLGYSARVGLIFFF